MGRRQEVNKPIIVIGLRRSGTTAIWRAFNSDQRLKSYNEPFNPEIFELSKPDFRYKKYYMEYKSLIEKGQTQFWELFSPIQNIQELKTGLTKEQRQYLNYLVDSALPSTSLLEMTRVHFKIADLAELYPNSVMVHLYRPAAAFVSSIMIPSNNLKSSNFSFISMYKYLKSKIRMYERQRNFWRNSNSNNAWSFDQLIGGSPKCFFASRLRNVNINPNMVYKLPAVGKLLAYWKVCYERAEQDGKVYFRDRFISLNFKEFCNNPEQALSRIYDLSGQSYVNRDLSWIHKHNTAFSFSNNEWKRYAEILNIQKEVMF